METIKEAISTLVNTTEKLRTQYPSKKFTLDGRLVGDIGEIITFIYFDIELYDKLEKHYDGYFSSDKEKKIQIKTTMKDSLTFPINHVPEFYLGLKIDNEGNHYVIYNGPGKLIKEYLNRRKTPETGLHGISNSILQKINTEMVNEEDRIPKRKIKE